MAYKSLWIAALLSMVSGKSITIDTLQSAPAFCNGLDCPKFTVLSKTKDYEERAYDASKWTSTLISGMDYQSAVSQGFMKLFDYISGDNLDKKKVAMTAPVTAKVVPGQGPACASNFTVSFMVPFADQDNPPKPADPNVYLSELPALKAYVRSFGGFASGDDYIKEALELDKALKASNTTSDYHTEFYYTAGYDAPFKPFNRHNEVWFIEL
ncbi:heme-binding protein 2-like isoform X2 [Ptychodera flava]